MLIFLVETISVDFSDHIFYRYSIKKYDWCQAVYISTVSIVPFFSLSLAIWTLVAKVGSGHTNALRLHIIQLSYPTKENYLLITWRFS
jgi:hypothetical protein